LPLGSRYFRVTVPAVIWHPKVAATGNRFDESFTNLPLFLSNIWSHCQAKLSSEFDGGQPDGLLGVADGDDGQDGSEDLLLHDGVVGLHVRQDGEADVPLLLVEVAAYISLSVSSFISSKDGLGGPEGHKRLKSDDKKPTKGQTG